MIVLRPSVQSDIDYVSANPIEEAVKRYPSLDLSGYARTAIVNDSIIGVGGVVIYWQGMGEVWIILHKDALTYKTALVLCMNNALEELVDIHKLKRVEATVREDFPKARELVEFLGFKRDGFKECYYPDGGNAICYGKLY